MGSKTRFRHEIRAILNEIKPLTRDPRESPPPSAMEANSRIWPPEPRRRPIPDTKSVAALIWSFQSPELQEHNFCFPKLPNHGLLLGHPKQTKTVDKFNTRYLVWGPLYSRHVPTLYQKVKSETFENCMIHSCTSHLCDLMSCHLILLTLGSFLPSPTLTLGHWCACYYILLVV